MFNPNELGECGQTRVNHNMGVTDVLHWMCVVHILFKVLTNFEIHKFDEFASFVCLTNCNSSHSTDVERVMSGRP